MIAQLKAALPAAELLESRTRAKADRRVWIREEPDGMATVCATVTDVDAHRIYRRLTAIAAGWDSEDDARSLDQKRADVFVDALLHTGRPHQDRAGDEPTPGAPGRPGDHAGAGTPDAGEVDVVIPLATLLGLADDPGHLQGLGPIPADIARELAADRSWRSWITDTISGLVVATSPSTYRPTAAVQRLVRAREPYCRYPGCRRPSTSSGNGRFTDLDHTLEFPEGPSEPWNLGPLCRRHHVLKTHHDYDLTGPPDEASGQGGGYWTWTTPTGITIHDEPEPPLAS